MVATTTDNKQSKSNNTKKYYTERKARRIISAIASSKIKETEDKIMFAVTRIFSPLAKAGMATSRATRSFASEAAEAAPVVKKSGGAGIFQRINSFFVGAGLTAVVTQFYIYNEIRDGNKTMISKQKELESRLAKLEGKK